MISANSGGFYNQLFKFSAMKRIIFAIWGFLSLGMVLSCNNEPDNPGDFSKECTLDIPGPLVSLTNGRTYPLDVARSTDTVYRYLFVVKDTVFDESGKPLIGSDGKIVTQNRNVYVNSKITARLVEMKPIGLPVDADTFTLDINSNAKWLAAQPQATGTDPQWYFNYGNTTTGGGDSRMQFRITAHESNLQSALVWQQIITSDSSVMYRIPFFRQASDRQ